jgi:tetratricopeptide (TPR) repeat protein
MSREVRATLDVAEEPMADKARGQIATPPSDALSTAIEAVKREPDNDQHWELVEELVDSAQRPSDVRELFRSVLHKRDLGARAASQIGQRAVRFYEAWYGDDSRELAELLIKVVEIDGGADWAFERLTVALTVAERWGDLLDVYDRAIARADHTAQRMKLLEEAAQVAKDFASQPDRAIGYMSQLFALEPDNASLAASLERLLERQGRYRDLISLWGSRIDQQPARQQRDTRQRMAVCYVDSLRDYAAALGEIEKLRKDAPEYKPALELLERILGSETAAPAERKSALLQLKEHFQRSSKPNDVVRVLERGLSFADPVERRVLLRELVQRALDLRDDERAFTHQAALLVLEPSTHERDALRTLAERTRDFERYVGALVEAARQSREPLMKAELSMEAARLREEQLGQLPEAIALYREVFDAAVSADSSIAAGRRLVKLLEQTDRENETLDVLSRMSELEPVEAVRKTMLGKVAQLAEKLGDKERARRAWRSRVGDDGSDVEALDALVAAAARDEDYAGLAKLLRQRMKVAVSVQARRADLVWLARISDEKLRDLETAILTWRQVHELHPDDSEAVGALTDLLSRAERWPELAEVLSRAAQDEMARFTALQTQLGDAYRTRLGKPDLAVLRYRTALQVDPRNPGARAGQITLISHEACRPIAVASLAEAYKQTDEWQHTVALLEPRLAAATSSSRRAEILTETAQLFEHQGKDPEQALECYRRAFALSPDDRATEREIRRLAETLGEWLAVVSAYRETIASFPKTTPRVAELRYEEGQVFETRVQDREAALEAYVEAARISPDRVEFASAAARVAGQLGQFRTAAEQAVAHMVVKAAPSEPLFRTLERVATEVQGYDALCIALSEVTVGQASSLPAAVSRELFARVATMHREQRNDPRAAESALLRGLRAEPGHRPTLLALAEVQRSDPGPALVTTLRSLAEGEDEQLDALSEAAEVCVEHVRDKRQLGATLEALYQRALGLWRRGKKATGKRDAPTAVAWSVDKLVAFYKDQNDPGRALVLLTEAAALPFEAAQRARLLHQAAALAMGPVGEPERAIDLYRDLLAHDPRDTNAMVALGQLFTAGERWPELLMLRRHELALASDLERKLALRLEIARLVGELETRGDRVGVLQANLAERAGHKPSLDSLNALLRQKGQHAELCTIFDQQARGLRDMGRGPEAAWLFRQVAELRERALHDVQGALAAYRELHALESDGDASEALARLHAGLGDHAKAAEWLEIRLAAAPPELRAATAIALARAQLASGQPAKARACLEQALAQDASVGEARELLAELYRKDGAHEQLARLLASSAEMISEPARRLAYLREAADLYYENLRAPDRAIPVLLRATELAPDDLHLRVMLAEGFHVAGRFDEARAVLKALIEGFGRKRSSERAELHYRLGRVCESAGLIDEAFGELEQASKMDLAHQGALHALARLAHTQGDLDRSERAYRGLLLLVRRQKADVEVVLGSSEVFYELYRIAIARNQRDTASELLASSLEAAAQSDNEAQRLSRLLQANGETELLLRVLDARMALAREPRLQAEILAAKSQALEAVPARQSEALDLRLQSLQLDQHSDALHAGALELAVRMGELSRYTDALGQWAEDAQRSRNPAGARNSALLTLRLGRVIEERLANLDHAAGLYSKVEASGECVIEAWFALARVAGARGDRAEQRRVLQRISTLDEKQADKQARDEARFLLAEMELADAQWRDEGVSSLARALEEQPDYARAKRSLSQALEAAPTHVGVLGLFEKVARTAQDDEMLLLLLERRALLPDATLEQLREGVELALRVQALERSEALLVRAAELVRKNGDSTEMATWVFSGLAECRLQAGDTKRAMGYLREAIKFAPEGEADPLRRELAALAAGPKGDLALAAEAYAGLLQREPAERSLWEPMLGILERLRDREHMDAFVQSTLGALLPVPERVFLMLRYARFLIETLKAERDAIPVLKQILDEDSTNLDATDKLLGIYQRHDLGAEFAELLQQQFDRARDERNLLAITELGLRLGAAYGSAQPEAAADVFRAALEWDPGHRGLLTALLSCLPQDFDPRERAELMLRLLKTETGPHASAMADNLADTFANFNDDERTLEALELGVAACPDDADLRQRLVDFYSEREQWRPLGALLMREAARLPPGEQAVAWFKQAAALYRDRLGDVDGAAEALRAALIISPHDSSLLAEHARNLAAAGKHEAAIEDVGRLLEAHSEADGGRVELLRVRADLCLAAGQPAAAVSDLNEAYQIARGSVAEALMSALEQLREHARASQDHEQGRRGALHLVSVLDDAGQHERARDVLAEWASEAPDDAEVLRALRDRDTHEHRWGDVAGICLRLLDVEQGDARIEAALGLADACDKLGQPEEALPALTRVHEDAPDALVLRQRLRSLYEQLGFKRELAALISGDAELAPDPADKLALLLRAAELFLEVGEPAVASQPLSRALQLSPDDDRTRLMLVDLHLSLERVDEAAAIVEPIVGNAKRKRSPELAMFQQRMARISALRGDRTGQLRWLNTALETDRKSGEVASELAEASMAIEDFDTAMKALRTLTMMEDPRPITRAMAFLKQAQIAVVKGDVQRAQHWARKAKSLDENLIEVDDFLAKIGG